MSENIQHYLFLFGGRTGAGFVQWLIGPELENGTGAGKESTLAPTNPRKSLVLV